MTTYLLLTLALLSIAPCLQWWWIDNNLPGAAAAPRVSVLSPFQPARMGEWLSLEEAESSDSLPGQRLSNLLPACREWSWLKPSRWGTWRPVSLIFPRGKMEFFFSQNNFFYKKSIFQEGHVLSENPPDWKFPNTFNENLHLLWRQHTRTAKYSLWWFMAGISHTPQHSCIFHSTSRLKVCMAVKTVWFGWTKSNLTRIRQPEEDSLPMRCYAMVPGECIKETKIKI